MDVFEYTDYRIFLRDYYTEKKNKDRGYSYRVFANKAKLASPNYLKLVIDGSRRITTNNLPQFLRGLGLKGSEELYFKNLVLFQEAKDQESKIHHERELGRLRDRRVRVTQQITEDRNEFLSSWHHMAIREMVELKDFRADPDWIARRLGNKTTAAQVKDSLELQKRLGFIVEKEGRLVMDEPLITTVDEVHDDVIRGLHRQFIQRGVEALDEISLLEREVRALTIALPKERVVEFKTAIKRFIEEMNRRFTRDEAKDEVYQLNVNFFPFTKDSGKREGNA